MKIFRTIENSGNLVSLLEKCERNSYFPQGFVDITQYFTAAGEKPCLQAKDGKYTSILLERYDGAKRYLGKGNDYWILYDILG